MWKIVICLITFKWQLVYNCIFLCFDLRPYFKDPKRFKLQLYQGKMITLIYTTIAN